MAGWISSKLKVAETLLQQIDQQAAESLGKNEKPRSDEFNYADTPTKNGGVVPLKDQLKKRTSEGNDFNGHIRKDSDSNSLHRDRAKEIEIPSQPSSNPVPTLTDSDWTELLSTPKQPTPPAVNRTNGISAIRGLRKDVKKQKNFGSNLLPLEVKRNQKSHNSVSKSTRRSDIGPKNRVNGETTSTDGKQSDGAESSSSDFTHGKSSFESQNDDGYLGGRENGQMLTGANPFLEPKDYANEEMMGILETAGDGMQSHLDIYLEKDSTREDVLQSVDANCTLEKASIPAMVDGVADTKIRVDGNDRFMSALGRIDDSNAALGSYVPRDLQRASPSASDGKSDSDTDSTSTSDSENERERARRREQIMAEKAAAKAVEAIKERENVIAKLEGEKQSLEKILEERAKQQAQEASELQMSMMETMEAVDLEKQKHNNTRMEALSRLAKLETANADLARSLATTQWNLEVEVNRVAELRQQIELKEVTHEELQRRMSKTHQSGSSLKQLEASKGVEYEREIIEVEYSFICDKIGQLQEKAKKLEENIEMTQKEMENPTEVEVELKRRLAQLTDHLIQKQAQVEALSSEKATVLFRMEMVSRLLDEKQSTPHMADLASPLARNDLESGTWKYSNSKLRPMFKDRIQSGRQHLGSLVQQLDAIFSAGSAFLRRNSTAKLGSLVYFVCLHFWVAYILLSYSQSSNERRSGAAISLENINNTTGV